MAKRKAAVIEDGEAIPRRSSRRKSAVEPAVESTTVRVPAANVKLSRDSNAKTTSQTKKQGDKTPKASITTSTKKPSARPAVKSSAVAKAETNGTASTPEKQYWLMKAEPESRMENGIDVAFSIDHLAAKSEPEPWDGIRAYPARNNLRAMKKGDLAFFYHSNCKEPGIVGVMEIVREHSPDLSAHDPTAPYYDEKSKPSDPKWSLVHVEFRRKFAAPITLKQLREMGTTGKPLENMQMLKQTRLSVSKVSLAEWEYLMGVFEEREAE